MNLTTQARLGLRYLRTVALRGGPPFFGTLIVTDRCNLSCRHCAVRDPHGALPSYQAVCREMRALHAEGVRVLIFSGGEPLLWRDGRRGFAELVDEARRIGFLGVSVATNGTIDLDLPGVDLVLLSLDGNAATHDAIRGPTHARILRNLDGARRRNVCIYMAVNALNHAEVADVAAFARAHPKVCAISYNFHTPYRGTEALSLSEGHKRRAVAEIARLIDEGYPILNLKQTLRAYLRNDWVRPFRYCRVTDLKRRYVCGRCVEEPGLCQACGYLFAAELGLLFAGDARAMAEALWVYPRRV